MYDGYLTSYQRIFIDEQHSSSNSSGILPEKSINTNYELCLRDEKLQLNGNKTCELNCRLADEQPDCVTGTITFWSFVFFMCLGTIGFNVANCVSDATCFDMLGELQQQQQHKQQSNEKTPLKQITITHTDGKKK